MSKTYIHHTDIKREYPLVYKNLVSDLVGTTFNVWYGESDVLFYEHNGELYLESHDEGICNVWRNNAWVELDFSDRPQDV